MTYKIALKASTGSKKTLFSISMSVSQTGRVQSDSTFVRLFKNSTRCTASLTSFSKPVFPANALKAKN